MDGDDGNNDPTEYDGVCDGDGLDGLDGTIDFCGVIFDGDGDDVISDTLDLFEVVGYNETSVCDTNDGCEDIFDGTL